MSWLFSQALEAEYLEANLLGGELSALSKLSLTAELYCASDKTTEYSRLSQFGMTCEPLMGQLGEARLMWYLGAFRAKTYRVPAQATGSMAPVVDFGKKCGESLARYDHHTFSWRTAQCSLFGGLSKFSGTWPRWGIVAHGELFQADTLEPQLKENDFLLPAPTKSMGKRGWGMSNRKARYSEQLESNARLFGYKPHPSILEWSMGWIVTWTKLKPLAMDKFQAWYASHGTSCAKESGRKKDE